MTSRTILESVLTDSSRMRSRSKSAPPLLRRPDEDRDLRPELHGYRARDSLLLAARRRRLGGDRRDRADDVPRAPHGWHGGPRRLPRRRAPGLPDAHTPRPRRRLWPPRWAATEGHLLRSRGRLPAHGRPLEAPQERHPHLRRE